eukprot:g5994.t1
MYQIIKVVVGVYQIISSFETSFNAVPWPQSFMLTMRYVGGIFNFDLFGAPVFACHSVGDTFPKRFLWHMFATLGMALPLVVALLHDARASRRVCLKQLDVKYKQRMAVKYTRRMTFLFNILLPFLFIIYPSASKTAVLMLRCTTVDDWWPEKSAAEEDKAFMIYLREGGRGNLSRKEWRVSIWAPRMRVYELYDARFGFLSNAYLHTFYWFESLVSFYKLTMTTLVLFVEGADSHEGTTLKILFSLFSATCFTGSLAFLQPYKDKDVLSVVSMVNLEVLFVLFAALYLYERPM